MSYPDGGESADQQRAQDAALALEHVRRSHTQPARPEEVRLVALAAAFDHGVTLDDLADATGHSIQTLRRIAVRLDRGERPEFRSGAPEDPVEPAGGRDDGTATGWFFRIIETANGAWDCRRGHRRLDTHAAFEEALAHTAAIARSHRPSTVFTHDRNGRVQAVVTFS